jgi:hypothetical protein
VLDDRESQSRQELGIFLFTTVSRPALGPTQPPIQWIPEALCLEVRWPAREAQHSPPSSAEVNNAWSYTSAPQYAFTTWCHEYQLHFRVTTCINCLSSKKFSKKKFRFIKEKYRHNRWALQVPVCLNFFSTIRHIHNRKSKLGPRWESFVAPLHVTFPFASYGQSSLKLHKQSLVAIWEQLPERRDVSHFV